MWDVNRGIIVPAGGAPKRRADQQIWVGNWSGVRGLEASPKRQFVTEYININSLADHHIWSTIKTLPATVPALRSIYRGTRTGVTGAVSQLDLDIGQGGGSWG